jgi:uncharacterized membrane protein YedE/YeeE
MVTAAPGVEASADPEGRTAAVRADAGSGIEVFAYLALGTFLGIVFVKSQVLSWYRIQEMFRFQSFHMYGVIGSAVSVAALSVGAIRRFDVRTLQGHGIAIQPKAWSGLGTRYWLGGFVFGLGWALLGACPGPIYTLIGAGYTVLIVPLAAAIAGTVTYGHLHDRLPH